MDHLIENNLISDDQHGFVGGRSTITNLLSTFNKWYELIDNGNDLDVLYLDFAKAFDSVPHNRLIHKLECYGIGLQGKVLQWIKSFISGRKQCISVNGER